MISRWISGFQHNMVWLKVVELKKKQNNNNNNNNNNKNLAYKVSWCDFRESMGGP